MIYLLKRVRGHEKANDEFQGFVVRASSEEQARKMVDDRNCWDDDFLDPKKTTCEKLLSKGKSEILLEDFNAG